jgi:hypothetical protein
MTLAQYFSINTGEDFACCGGHPDAGRRPLDSLLRGWTRADADRVRRLIHALMPFCVVNLGTVDMSGRDRDTIAQLVVDRINAISINRTA